LEFERFAGDSEMKEVFTRPLTVKRPAQSIFIDAKMLF
jgi:hypothetical protein